MQFLYAYTYIYMTSKTYANLKRQTLNYLNYIKYNFEANIVKSL